MACILIGLYKSKSINTLKEYTLGNGSFSDIIIITTLFATDMGATLTIGSVEKVYMFGVFFAITRMLMPVTWFAMVWIYGKNISQFRGCMSISDIMELLYGTVGRWITNIASVLVSISIIALQATAMGYILHYFFKIPDSFGVIVSVFSLVIYSAFGGISAVAITDVFQFVVFMIAIPITCAIAYHDVGEYNGIVQSLPHEMSTLSINKENILLFLGFIFYNLLPQSCGTFIQRFLISKDTKQLTKCMKIVAILHIPLAVIICAIGFMIKVKAPDISPSTSFIYFIENYISIGFRGLIISGILAVIMSTADSWLNTTSVLTVHDIVRKLIPLTEKQALISAKIITFIIGILAIFLTLTGKGIIELGLLASSFWEPLMLVPLAAGFLKFRTNSKSFISATIFAISFTAISGYIVGDLAATSLMCGVFGSAIGLFGMHYWQVHQGVLNVNTQQAKLTNTNINENANMDRKIALAESQGIHMFEDVEEQTKTIADELRKQSFIQGAEKGNLEGKEEVARNLLVQGLDIRIIENATGLSRKDLAKLQKNIKTTH